MEIISPQNFFFVLAVLRPKLYSILLQKHTEAAQDAPETNSKSL